MPYFQEQAPWFIEWCPKHRAWFGRRASSNAISCCVLHGPGDCCHFGMVEMRVEPIEPKYTPQLNFETTTYTLEHPGDEGKDRSLKP